jgi:hypothetical protein
MGIGMMEKEVKSVQKFWNTEACGTHFIADHQENDAEFFKKYREYRYTTELPMAFERFLASRLGWYLFIYIRKPSP